MLKYLWFRNYRPAYDHFCDCHHQQYLLNPSAQFPVRDICYLVIESNSYPLLLGSFPKKYDDYLYLLKFGGTLFITTVKFNCFLKQVTG